MPDPIPRPLAEASHADLVDALRAVHEALDIPRGATVADNDTRETILYERRTLAVVILRMLFDHDATGSSLAWHTGYLRELLAEYPTSAYNHRAEVAR